MSSTRHTYSKLSNLSRTIATDENKTRWIARSIKHQRSFSSIYCDEFRCLFCLCITYALCQNSDLKKKIAPNWHLLIVHKQSLLLNIMLTHTRTGFFSLLPFKKISNQNFVIIFPLKRRFFWKNFFHSRWTVWLRYARNIKSKRMRWTSNNNRSQQIVCECWCVTVFDDEYRCSHNPFQMLTDANRTRHVRIVRCLFS